MDPPNIVPPPGVRTIIDKTVPVVRQNESTAHKLLLSKPKLFSFLNAADPYHAWYQWRLKAPTDLPAEVEEESEKPLEIDPLRFSAQLPAISAKDLQIIKLTAMYSAQDESFSKALPSEGQFAFLDPNHSLNQLYCEFINQYKLLRNPPADVLARLDADVLELAAARAKYNQQIQDQLEIEHQETEKSRIEFAQIDWQDFVVVETVIFADDEEIDHKPLRKEDVEVKRLVKPKGSEIKLRSAYTGELIPASEFDEHMRIMNLDPTWKQQRDVSLQRQSTTNLDMAHAAANLKRMMSTKNSPRKRR